MQAGAGEVILSAAIGGLRIAHSVLEPEVSQLLHRDAPRDGAETLGLRAVGLAVSELSLRKHCTLVGRNICRLHQLGNGELMILGVQRSSEILRAQWETMYLQEGDAIMAITGTGKLSAAIASKAEQTKLL